MDADAADLVDALARDGLLVDVEQSVEVEKLKGLLEQESRDHDWVLARIRQSLGTPDGRAISIHAREVATDLQTLREQAANAFADTAQLKAMFADGGAMNLEMVPPHELVVAWVRAARHMLGEAPNYSETPVSMEVKAAGETERFIFTVQRENGLTPHQARRQAEAERDELKARVDQHEELLAYLWLYVKWRYVTKQLTTEQKNLWADAIEKISEREHPGEGTAADRWWQDDQPTPGEAKPSPVCPCFACVSPTWGDMESYMVVCETCGNKRCPHARFHGNSCTGSNEPGQAGSDYHNAWKRAECECTRCDVASPRTSPSTVDSGEAVAKLQSDDPG
ncbi:hypothetical protein [Amycolatopsis sp. NPDC059657]|uniref:hypothetical protein n=1 Tax=Amycolatopsis sp. NPDC059657 TaxID=3346899 RepID=UPI00366FC8C0